MSFLEERLNEEFSFGSSVVERYEFYNHTTASGDEYRVLLHPYPRLIVDLDFINKTGNWMESYLLDFYRKTSGGYDGFRWKNPTDYSSNSLTGTPTDTDSVCIELSSTTFQMVQWYGTQGDISQPHRKVKKPVSGTIVVSADDVPISSGSPNQYSVDTTTGIITLTSASSPTPVIKAGFEYDVPLRFDLELSKTFITRSGSENIISANGRLVEILNP